MKNYIIGLVTSIILIAIFSFSLKNNNIKTVSKAEEVPLILKEYKTHQFYLEQAKLWKEELKLNKKDENAWFNLFKANRFAKLTYNDEHSPELSWQQNEEWIKEANHLLEGKEIIKQIEVNIPKTFMAYYLKFYNSIDRKGKFHLLEKAYAINPNFYEIYDDFIAHYELTGNELKRKEFNKKWFESNDFSENLLNYNFNVLSSLKENSIIFSYGDNDFFAPIMLQDALGVREDVTIVNIPLMVNEIEYRNSTLKKLNIKQFNKDYGKDFGEKNMKEMIDYIIANKSKDLPLYFGLGCHESLKKDFEDKLYMIGLALEYSEENIDNLAELKNNFDNKYLLDYIKIQFSKDSYDANSNNANYIHGLSCLYDHYKLSGDVTKMIEMRELALTIANSLEGEHMREYKEFAIHHFSK
jgi:hypothetical protein